MKNIFHGNDNDSVANPDASKCELWMQNIFHSNNNDSVTNPYVSTFED